MIIYVSGKYSGNSEKEISANIKAAREASIKLWEQGHTALCPHLNTAHFEKDCDCNYSDYISGDLKLLARCDAIFMLNGFEKSNGAKLELEYADKNNIPIFFEETGLDIALHSTEISSPIQCDAFINQVMHMYRVHLDKNADYSPANILGTGNIGVVVRIWDKVARLMNLSGFKIEVKAGRFSQPKNPKNESLDDTFDDLANYAIIARLLHSGKWGK